MNRLAVKCFVAFFAFAAKASPSGPVIPTTHTTALDGHPVELPHDLNAATVLILGFSRNSEATTTAWEKQVRANLAGGAIGFYDMPMLAEVPGFVRGVVVRSIRKKVPEDLRPNFAPLTEDEDQWRKVAGYAKDAPDAAYVLLVDRMGIVHWSTHEAVTPEKFAELSAQTRSLAESSR